MIIVLDCRRFGLRMRRGWVLGAIWMTMTRKLFCSGKFLTSTAEKLNIAT
jgi:hypothetical protein